MVVHARYRWDEHYLEHPTRPDIAIPCAVLVLLPRDWTTTTGTVCARYGTHHLVLTWIQGD